MTDYIRNPVQVQAIRWLWPYNDDEVMDFVREYDASAKLWPASSTFGAIIESDKFTAVAGEWIVVIGDHIDALVHERFVAEYSTDPHEDTTCGDCEEIWAAHHNCPVDIGGNKQ